MTKQRAKQLAKELLNEHGLGKWRFSFDRAKTRYGLCRHRKKEISLSKFYVKLNNEVDIKDTILHEIAHALLGSGYGHNNKWKRKCIEIGCSPSRTTNVEAKIEGKFIAICPNCKTKTFRHRLPKYTRRTSCGQCSSTFDERFLLEYKLNK